MSRERTLLPETPTPNLVVDDEGDELNDETQAALLARISAGWKSAQEGRLRPASELIDTLRVRRR